MFVVSGATGRVGSAVAHNLLAADRPVRVIVRSANSARDWERAGAQVAVLDLRSSDALESALEGAEGFFAMLPFDLGVDDLETHAEQISNSVAAAVEGADVPHVVMLSSGGAHLPDGTGPIVGLHRMELKLRSTGTTLTALRACHFQEKVGDVLHTAIHGRVFPVFASNADTAIPMVATADVGDIAARLLLNSEVAYEVVNVLGPAYTEREVARELGAALGVELQVVVIPMDGWQSALTGAGLPPQAAVSVAQLYKADSAGLLAPAGGRTERAGTELKETLRRLVSPGTGPAKA